MLNTSWFVELRLVLAMALALIYSADSHAGVPLQLETLSIVVPNPDGGTTATAMTVYLDVKDEKKVRSVCQSLQHLKEAFFVSLQEHPIKSHNRMLQMQPAGGLLEEAAAKVLGPEVVEKIYVMPGRRKFGEGTAPRSVSGATRHCIALQKVPTFAVLYDRSLHKDEKTTVTAVAKTPTSDGTSQPPIQYPTDQGQSIFAVPKTSEAEPEENAQASPEAAPTIESSTDINSEQPLKYELEPKSPTGSDTQIAAPTFQSGTTATIPPDPLSALSKPDLAAEYDRNAKSKILKHADKNVDTGAATSTWVMLGIFGAVVLAGGAFLGFGIMRFRSDRRQKKRRDKERRRNFEPYTGEERRVDSRRNKTDQRGNA